MSIQEEIWEQVGNGSLVELRPDRIDEGKPRRMYLTTELYEELTMERDTLKEMERYANLEADLKVFLVSPTIDPKYLFGLTPAGKGVWEIRSRRHKPSIRVFGQFAAKDTFIATHCALRPKLGGWKSFEFKREIHKSRQTWNKLFTYPAVIADIHDLVTGAIDGKYFK